jgi:hypothetical protein
VAIFAKQHCHGAKRNVIAYRRYSALMKFAHIRVSEYFTFAKQIYHSGAISLARKVKFR